MPALATDLPFFDTFYELDPLDPMRPSRIVLPLLAAGFLLVPESARAQSRRTQLRTGLDLLQKGRSAEALAHFRKLTEQDPTFLAAWNNRAAVEAARGDLEAANSSLEKATESHPDFALLQRNLARIRSRLARLAYDSAFSTSSALPPLQLDLQRDVSGRNDLAASDSPRDSLLQALEDLRESQARELSRRDSLLAIEVAEVRRLKNALDRVASARNTGPAGSNDIESPVQGAPSAGDAGNNLASAGRRDAPIKAKNSSHRGGETSEGVLNALQNWAQAWSAKDPEAYLACYSSRFVPPGKASRADWEAYRRERIASPQSIKVTLTSTRVRMLPNHRAEVSFRQSYQTESVHLTSRKRLEFAFEKGAWKIYAEREAR